MSFQLSEMSLLSELEQKARKVRFDPQLTVIEGPNDTGKSVLAKSIYWAFGAEPRQVHPKWRAASPTCLLQFTLGDERYRLLRHADFIALFRGDHLFGTYTRITTEFAPAFSELVGFGLRLVSRTGESLVPPPAYYFAPFYVDQDRGWVSNWQSFERLGQFANWQGPTIDYHTGILGAEYFALTEHERALSSELADLADRLAVLNSVLQEIQEEAESILFDVDLEAFQVQVVELLDRCERLRTVERKLQRDIQELHNQRAALGQSIRVVRGALAEARDDFAFLVSDADDDIECPTCGAHYHNSFAERFAIAQDEQRLLEFLVDLESQVTAIDDALEALRRRHTNQREEVRRVEAMLVLREREVTLDELLRAQGRHEVRRSFREKVEASYRLVRDKELERGGVEDRLRELKRDSREKRAYVNARYGQLMKAFCSELNVRTLPPEAFERPARQIRETGSDLPRALLAYYFSFLHLIRDVGPTAFAPIVIDSPNQQAQDRENLQVLLEFIRAHQPPNSQLILALEDRYGIAFGGARVELSEKYSVLRGSEYEEVAAEVLPLMQRALTEDLTGRSGTSSNSR